MGDEHDHGSGRPQMPACSKKRDHARIPSRKKRAPTETNRQTIFGTNSSGRRDLRTSCARNSNAPSRVRMNSNGSSMTLGRIRSLSRNESILKKDKQTI